MPPNKKLNLNFKGYGQRPSPSEYKHDENEPIYFKNETVMNDSRMPFIGNGPDESMSQNDFDFIDVQDTKRPLKTKKEPLTAAIVKKLTS